jgi:nucleotide-binding universal stress UspA family protein
VERIQSIVVPTDFSPLAQAAAARAATLARLDGASIHLVHAVRFPLVAAPYEVPLSAAVWEELRRGATVQLEEERKAVEARGVATVTAEIADPSDPVEAIHAAAASRAADLIVMGTHGHGGLKHAFLGSVAERTLRTASRPVLAVKEDVAKAEQPIRRILLAVDFSVHSDRAVELAAGLAKRLAAAVDVVHAFDLPLDYVPYASDFGTELEQKIQTVAGERLESARERLAKAGVAANVHTRRGHASEVIADLAGKLGAQLVVMGTRGNSGLAHVLLGSVAERTLRMAPCSVLAVHAVEADRS